MNDAPKDFWDKNGAEKSGLFDGVIIAPQNWIDNPTADVYGGGNRMSANAIGWLKDKNLFASDKDDIIFYAGSQIWLHDRGGNDIIIAGGGVPGVSLGNGNDTVYFGYKRYGKETNAFDEDTFWDGKINWGGKKSYLVIKGYGQGHISAGKYDRLMFNQKQDEIGYGWSEKFDYDLNQYYGRGTVIYKNEWTNGNDLLAYVIGATPDDIKWGIDNGHINFNVPFFDLDSHNRMHNYHKLA